MQLESNPSDEEHAGLLESDVESESHVVPRSNTFKGTLLKMTLLVGVLSIGVVAYIGFRPQPAQDTFHKGDENELVGMTTTPGMTVTGTPAVTNTLPGTTPKSVGRATPSMEFTLDNVLKKAVKNHGVATQLNPAGADTAATALNACQPHVANYDLYNKCVQANREAIRTAVEEVSEETTPEEALEGGTLVTSRMLQQMNGLTDTPEAAPMSAEDSTHIIDGDMILEKPTGGRRLWAGNIWPDKSAIPYCFDASLASSSKTAFLAALTHISSLVSCIGWKQVAVTRPRGASKASFGKCAEEGIYVQSLNEGCYSYVGRTAWRQTLNLQANGCDILGIAAHEILHAMGVAHEQARPDYTQHIQIFWSNIKQDKLHNYEVSSGADVSLPYDIMSLMHYGDTDFGINGAKTMKALGHHRGIMGQRMGLSSPDAKQLGLMYSCSSDVKDFKLCTNSATQCTKTECACHNAGGGSSTIKTIDANGCQRCQRACPSAASGYCNSGCGCGVGHVVKTLQKSNGGVCYACEVGASPPPAPPSPPSPPPAPPAPPPASELCAFPTSYSTAQCKTDMPGCTNCDGDSPWCFKTGGGWKYCTKEDNACIIPFEYGSKKYWTCTKDGDTKPWCYKYGGGWKYCGVSDGFEFTLTPPTPAPPTPPPPPPPSPPVPPPPPPTPPPPPPAGCHFPFTIQGHTVTGGCYKYQGDHYCPTSNGQWMMCTADENLCSFPFNDGGQTRYACAPWYFGKTWCPKVGGGWKWC